MLGEPSISLEDRTATLQAGVRELVEQALPSAITQAGEYCIQPQPTEGGEMLQIGVHVGPDGGRGIVLHLQSAKLSVPFALVSFSHKGDIAIYGPGRKIEDSILQQNILASCLAHLTRQQERGSSYGVREVHSLLTDREMRRQYMQQWAELSRSLDRLASSARQKIHPFDNRPLAEIHPATGNSEVNMVCLYDTAAMRIASIEIGSPNRRICIQIADKAIFVAAYKSQTPCVSPEMDACEYILFGYIPGGLGDMEPNIFKFSILPYGQPVGALTLLLDSLRYANGVLNRTV